ncbi:MAG: aspartate--tRNA ligase [Spirochaetales bacterium]|jgi:aspartyl-tRNA synthetase|nr:aspartate--tRNA ligase [Spirochaetales bacterium]
MKLKRTRPCGGLRETDIGSPVVLSGWVENYRDHGGVAFIDLRDRWGLVQTVFYPDLAGEGHKLAHTLRSEDVISVAGRVHRRPSGMENPKLPTGEIEVYVEELELLNRSQTPPFSRYHSEEVNPETRLKHRYLDLRGERLHQNLCTRSRIVKVIRDYFGEHDFVDIETPILGRSTPEGARDYLVPSRVNPGRFYALPQSPQLYKQALMIAGFERYIQIARCFRDEDLRANRQPEFTQVDVEMSFVDQEDVINLTEGLFVRIFNEALGLPLAAPFARISYDEAMLKYGKDSPDLRFDLEIKDLSDIFAQSSFGVFKAAMEQGGCVRGINLRGAGEQLSRKDLDDMTPFVKQFKGKGAAWIRMTPEGPQSPIVKYFSPEEGAELYRRMDAKAGDVLIFLADKTEVVCQCLGELRLFFGKRLKLYGSGSFSFAWVVDFPLFTRDPRTGRPTPTHHPFTAPHGEDREKLKTGDYYSLRSQAYDIVLNGCEAGGGSIRIHDPQVQGEIFSIIGIDQAEAAEKFGFLLEALRFGAPPHGGIALGLDRLIMLLLGEESIQNVIAFPKTQRASCLMTDCPNTVDEEQLEELKIALTLPETQGEPSIRGASNEQ